MNFGVDMLHLGSKDFRLQTVKGWGIKSGNKVGEELHPLGFTMDGFKMEGAGYYINRTDGSPNNCTWEVNRHGLFFQLNPSTLLHKFNLTTDLEPAWGAIRNDMDLLGIELDLEGASVNRLDLTKQAVMKAPAASFHPAFSALEGKRMKSTRHPDGYTFGNRQKEVVFYDKSLQLATVKDVHDAPPNLLRCEGRWKKRKVIGHETNGVGVGSFADLLARTSSDLETRYKGMLNTQIFSQAHGHQLTFDFTFEVEVIRSYIEENERAGWRKYVMAKGTEGLMYDFGSLEVFGRALVESGLHQRTAQRAVKELRGSMFKQSQIDRMRERKTLTSSIEELRQTFAA